MSPMIAGRPWTLAEDDLVRAHYLDDGGPEKLAAQLGRSYHAIEHRGNRLGLHRKRRWTDKEMATMRDLWGEVSLLTLAKRLGRTQVAVYCKAMQEGLPEGVPDGCELVGNAAKRCGFSHAAMERILARAGVKTKRTMSQPKKGRARWRRQAVDIYEANEAVEAWCAQETLEEAARRKGMDKRSLERRLVLVPGVPKKPDGKRHWRIPSDIIDRAVAGESRAS